MPRVAMPRFALALCVVLLASVASAAPSDEALARARASLALAATAPKNADEAPAPRAKTEPKCPTCPAQAPKDTLVRVKSGNQSGSGTVVWTDGTRSFVVTAAHVLAPGSMTHVRARGKWHAVTVRVNDTKADVAVLEVPIGLTAAPVSQVAPTPGQEVEMLGCTSLWSRSKVVGTDGGTYLLAGDPDCDFSDSGDSGGGVFLNGALCGVHCGKRGDTREKVTTPYCVDAPTVRAALALALDPKTPTVQTAAARQPTPAPAGTLVTVSGRILRWNGRAYEYVDEQPTGARGDWSPAGPIPSQNCPTSR